MYIAALRTYKEPYLMNSSDQRWAQVCIIDVQRLEWFKHLIDHEADVDHGCYIFKVKAKTKILKAWARRQRKVTSDFGHIFHFDRCRRKCGWLWQTSMQDSLKANGTPLHK